MRLWVSATLEAGGCVVGAGRGDVEPVCRGVADDGLGEEDVKGCDVGPEEAVD